MCHCIGLGIGRSLGRVITPGYCQIASAQGEDKLTGKLDVTQVERGVFDGVEQTVAPADRRVADGPNPPARRRVG